MNEQEILRKMQQLQRTVDDVRNQTVGKIRTLSVRTQRHETQIADLAAVAQDKPGQFINQTLKKKIGAEVDARIAAAIEKQVNDRLPDIVAAAIAQVGAAFRTGEKKGGKK